MQLQCHWLIEEQMIVVAEGSDSTLQKAFAHDNTDIADGGLAWHCATMPGWIGRINSFKFRNSYEKL